MRPDDRSYTESPEWARLDGDLVTVGITDFAVQQLGEIVFLDLPAAGTAVEKGESFGEVESVKAVSDLYAPVSGEIVEVNAPLTEDQTALQEDPLGAGWLLRLRVADPATALEGLLDAAAYEKHVAEAS